MGTPDRHIEMVNAAARSVGTVPLTRRDLPTIGTVRLQAARDEAAAAVTAWERRCDALDAEIRARRDEHDRVGELLARRAATRSAAEEERTAASHEHRELGGRLAEAEQTSTAVEQALGDWRHRAEELRQLHTQLCTALQPVSLGPLTPPARSELCARLDDIAVAMSHLDLDDVAVAVHEWADALRDGSAPLDPTATALLQEMEDLDRRWQEAGAGDPSSDPGVLAARDELLAAQEAMAKLDSQAKSGALGERLRRVIEQAHTERVRIEEQGRKADLAELARAREAEDEALGLVGFDSMLDYRVAMSTTGTGSLAETQRRTAATRIEVASEDLERKVELSRSQHAEIRRLGDEVERRARELLRGADGSHEEALRSMYAVPPQVSEVAATILQKLEEAEQVVTGHRDQLAGLSIECGRMAERRAALEQAGARAVATIDAADADSAEASADLARLDEQLRMLEEQSRRARDELAQAARTRSMLDVRRYMDTDVAELRDVLVELIDERARHASESGDGPSAVVLDDPLDELEPADALQVFDAVLAADWPAQVIYVTSRPELLARARSQRGAVRCLDGRRRVAHGRLRRRLGRAESIAS